MNIKKVIGRTYYVIHLKTNQFLGCFSTRKDAVFYCKANQTLPLPDNEWEDEFDIREL